MRTLLVFILSLSFLYSSGQFRRLNQKEEELATNIKGAIEGYASTIAGESKGNLLIANCTSPTIAWLTETPKKIAKNKNLIILLKAKIDLSSRKEIFNLLINGQQRFTIYGSNEKDWIIEGEERSSVEFQYFELDENNDAIGYMIIRIPPSWVTKGQPVTFQIDHECQTDKGWIMIAEDPNSLSHLKKKADVETWIDAKLSNEGKTQNLEISAPPEYTNKMFEFVIGNSIRGRKLAILRENRAYVSFTVKNSKANTDGMSLEVIANGESLFTFPDIYKSKIVEKTDGDIATVMEGGMYLGKKWNLHVKKLYQPAR